MKATETHLILCQMDAGEITPKEAHELTIAFIWCYGIGLRP